MLILSPEDQHKGSSSPSVRSPVVDNERMSPGHWLWSVLWFSYSALTMFGWVTGRACSL